MTTKNYNALVIDEKAHNYGKIYASLLKSEFQRKRAYSSIVALFAFVNILEETPFDVQKSMTLFRNPQINEEYEISDLYLNNWHIDVRVVTGGDSVLLPKIHFESDILPDFYAVIKVDASLSTAGLIGFVDTKSITKEDFDNKYYYTPLSTLITYDEFLEKIKKKKEYNFSLEEHELFKNSYLSLIDNELDKNTKNKVLKHLFQCSNCRVEFCCFTGFEMVCCNIAKHQELLEDQTLGFIGAQKVEDKKYEGKEETIYFDTEEQEIEEEQQKEEDTREIEHTENEKDKTNKLIENENTPSEREETVSDILDELFNIDEGYIDDEKIEEKQITTDLKEENQNNLSSKVEESKTKEDLNLSTDEDLSLIDDSLFLDVPNSEDKIDVFEEIYEGNSEEIINDIDILENINDLEIIESPIVEENQNNDNLIEENSTEEIKEEIKQTEEITEEIENNEDDILNELLPEEQTISEQKELNIEIEADDESDTVETNYDSELVFIEEEKIIVENDDIDSINTESDLVLMNENTEINADEIDEITVDSSDFNTETTDEITETEIIDENEIEKDNFNTDFTQTEEIIDTEKNENIDEYQDKELDSDVIFTEENTDSNATKTPIEPIDDDFFNDSEIIINDSSNEIPIEIEDDIVDEETMLAKEEPIQKVIVDYDTNGQPIYSYVEPVINATSSNENDFEPFIDSNEETFEELIDSKVSETPEPSTEEIHYDSTEEDEDKDNTKTYESVEDEENNEEDTDMNKYNNEYDDEEYDVEDYLPEENTPKSSNGIAFIIISILVLLGLVGGGAFLLLKNKNTNEINTVDSTNENIIESTENTQINDMFEQPVQQEEQVIVEEPNLNTEKETNTQQNDLTPPPSINSENKIVEEQKENIVDPLTESDLIKPQKQSANGDVNKAMVNAFNTMGSQMVSLRDLNWFCASDLFSEMAFKNYLQKIDNTLKQNLKSNFMNLVESSPKDSVAVKFAIDNRGNLKKVIIAESSGSETIDNVVLQSINETFESEKSQILNDNELKGDMYYLKVVIKL